MKLYYTKGACSLVDRIAVNELNLSIGYESVDLKNKITETGSNFLEINPKGAVPTLVADNNEILTENAVILQYLADSQKASRLLPPVGDFQRYRVLEWLNYIATEVHKGFAPLFNPEVPKEIKNTIFIPILKKKFTFINKNLQHHKYLVSDEFTLPDMYLFVMLTWAKSFKLDLSDLAKLTAYFDELKTRESIAKSLKEEGLSF